MLVALKDRVPRSLAAGWCYTAHLLHPALLLALALLVARISEAAVTAVIGGRQPGPLLCGVTHSFIVSCCSCRVKTPPQTASEPACHCTCAAQTSFALIELPRSGSSVGSGMCRTELDAGWWLAFHRMSSMNQ